MKRLATFLVTISVALPMVASAALTDNLMGYWDLDTDSTDSTAGAHDGTDTSVSYSSTGAVISGAVQCGGNPARVIIADHADFNGTTAITMNGWVTFSNTTGQQIMFAKADSALNAYMYMAKSATHHLSASVDTDVHNTVGTATLTDSVLYMWTVTYDGTTLKLYLNGASDATDITYSAALTPGTGGLGICRLGDYSTQYLIGAVDEVGFWSRALTDAEITSLYNAGAGFAYPFSSGPTFVPRVYPIPMFWL